MTGLPDLPEQLERQAEARVEEHIDGDRFRFLCPACGRWRDLALAESLHPTACSMPVCDDCVLAGISRRE